MLLMINPIDVVNETLPYDTTAHFYLFFACVFIKYLLCEGLQVMGNTDNEWLCIYLLIHFMQKTLSRDILDPSH